MSCLSINEFPSVEFFLHAIYIMHHGTFQEDGDRKIELKPRFLMEHDEEDVNIFFL